MSAAEIKKLQDRVKLLERLLGEAVPFLRLLHSHLVELGLADKAPAVVELIDTIRKV